jgi:hypothetical protein
VAGKKGETYLLLRIAGVQVQCNSASQSRAPLLIFRIVRNIGLSFTQKNLMKNTLSKPI